MCVGDNPNKYVSCYHAAVKVEFRYSFETTRSSLLLFLRRAVAFSRYAYSFFVDRLPCLSECRKIDTSGCQWGPRPPRPAPENRLLSLTRSSSPSFSLYLRDIYVKYQSPGVTRKNVSTQAYVRSRGKRPIRLFQWSTVIHTFDDMKISTLVFLISINVYIYRHNRIFKYLIIYCLKLKN